MIIILNYYIKCCFNNNNFRVLIQAIAAMLKISDLVKSFDGSGCFATWLEKFELVVELQGIDSPQSVLPLLLEGGAFLVYKGLDKETRLDFELLKKALSEAFLPDSVSSYELFSSRKLQPGESIDVYAASLKKFASSVSPGNSEYWVKNALVAGLPSYARSQVCAVLKIQEKTLAEIIGCARAVLEARNLTHIQQGFVALKGSKSTKCFQCGELGHVRSQCQNRNGGATVKNCFVCGSKNHLARECKDRVVLESKNGARGTESSALAVPLHPGESSQ